MSDQRQPDHNLIEANKDLRTALRERAREVPPADIDARILAAARRAVGSGPVSTSRTKRWFRMIDTPFATAAVVLVSASLLLLMREQGQFDHAALKEYRQESGSVPAATTTPAPVQTTGASPATVPVPMPATEAGAPAAAQGKVEDKAARAEPTELIEAPRMDVGGTTPDDNESDRRAGAAATTVAEPPPSAEATNVRGETKQRAEEVRSETPPAAPAASGENAVNAFPDAVEEKRERSLDEMSLAKKKAAISGSASTISTDAIVERKAATTPAVGALREEANQPAMAPGASSAGNASLAAPAPSAASAEQSETQATARMQSNKDVESAPVQLSEQDKMLQSIRQLIKDGKFSDAQLALRQFTKNYPHQRIPADILAALKPSD
ncbi:MAG: hypothetical protein U1F34_01165 [Gammaproteobacteria bacterium]